MQLYHPLSGACMCPVYSTGYMRVWYLSSGHLWHQLEVRGHLDFRLSGVCCFQAFGASWLVSPTTLSRPGIRTRCVIPSNTSRSQVSTFYKLDSPGRPLHPIPYLLNSIRLIFRSLHLLIDFDIPFLMIFLFRIHFLEFSHS